MVQLSLGLASDPAKWKATALESGKDILGKVVRQAIADKRPDVAEVATSLLGQISKADELATDKYTALTEALFAPDRRVQMAAAEALVNLEPKAPFLGSSRVVPILSRFVTGLELPRALVVDGNPARAALVAGYLRGIGYDARAYTRGAAAVVEALRSADVELIVVDPTFIDDPWKLPDLLGNLKADSRTAGLPVALVGPLALPDEWNADLESFPNVKFLVSSMETGVLKSQVDRIFRDLNVKPMSAEERAERARKAASLLARIAARPKNPFEVNLIAAEPDLALALNGPIAGTEASSALANITGYDAQRSLADLMLDVSRDQNLRLKVAGDLTTNIRRFGPRLTIDQERRLVNELASESDPKFQEALAAVVGALKPRPDASASRLSTYRAYSR